MATIRLTNRKIDLHIVLRKGRTSTSDGKTWF